MTKAVGAVAAAILVERGQVASTRPWATAIPAFDALPVLDGWDGETPRLRAAAQPARPCASSSRTAPAPPTTPGTPGCSATAAAPAFRRRAAAGCAALTMPLAFDPGEGWAYGTRRRLGGPPHRGRRRAPHRRLLPRRDLRAARHGRDGLRARRPRSRRASRRCGCATARASPSSRRPRWWSPSSTASGHALIGTAPDYLRFLACCSAAASSTAAASLSEATVAELLANQIGPRASSASASFQPEASADVDFLPRRRSHLEPDRPAHRSDIPGRRAAGAQGWGGVLEHPLLARPGAAAGRAMLMTQLRPFADPRVSAALDAFERAAHDL